MLLRQASRLFLSAQIMLQFADWHYYRHAGETEEPIAACRRDRLRAVVGPRAAEGRDEGRPGARVNGRATRSGWSPALTPNAPPGASDWIPCRCCGRSFPADNLVRFYDHPDDGLCVRCVEWLHARSRPIARRLYPMWQLPARVRGRIPPGRVREQEPSG